MSRKQAPPPKDAPAINRWVYDAMTFAGLGQTELANALFAKNALTSPDKSIVNKIVRAQRDVLAKEAIAIAEITGFPAFDDDASSLVSVPLVSWISAGALAREDLRDEALGEIHVGDLPNGDWIALKVIGDSMDRISPPESVILVNRREKRLVSNACYVIDDGEGNATYKRYRPDPMRFEPVSTNPTHEPLFPDNEPTIVGRVGLSMLKM